MKKRGLLALLAAAMLVTCMAGALAETTQDEAACQTRTWSNGVCKVCGYTCQHTDRKQTGGDQENKTIVDNKDGTHTCTALM